MSTVEWTEAQIQGLTNTSVDAGPDYLIEPAAPPNHDQPTLEENVFGGPPETLIPGMGESGEGCGTWRPHGFCDGEEHHVDLRMHLCGRRECDRCWSGEWAGPRTASVVSRLAAGRHVEEPGIDRRMVNGVVSPPEGAITSVEQMYDEGRPRAIELAKEHGIRGGYVVVHPFRVLEDAKERFRSLVESGDWNPKEDGGIWRWIRENDRWWYGQVYWSPHYHVIGLCRDFAPSDPEGDDGWVVKNVERGGSHSLEPFRNLHDEAGYNDMIAAVRYVLSHSAVTEDRNGVTPFGSVHALSPEEELSKGAWDTIQRMVEELVGSGDGREDGDLGDDDEEECPVEGCEGTLHPIWDVPAYIDQHDDLEIEALVRLRLAFDWAIGDDDDIEAPGGGWPRPESEETARETFDELAELRCRGM
jgi:hypothetical protein